MEIQIDQLQKYSKNIPKGKRYELTLVSEFVILALKWSTIAARSWILVNHPAVHSAVGELAGGGSVAVTVGVSVM